MADNVVSRVITLLSRADSRLADDFEQRFKGEDSKEAVTEFYCGELQNLNVSTDSLRMYLQDRSDCEFRWFRCFSDQVIPALKNNLNG